MSLIGKRPDPKESERLTVPKQEPQTDCRLDLGAFSTPGEIRCPICHHIVPPEHIGYKLHCRRCGYLESCCNPL